MLTSWLEHIWTGADPEVLLQSISRYYKFLPRRHSRQAFLSAVNQQAWSTRRASWTKHPPRPTRCRRTMANCIGEVLARDGWRCQACGSMRNLQVHHRQFRSQAGADEEPNLITLCAACHVLVHR